MRLRARLTLVTGMGFGVVIAAAPVFAQSACADLAGETFGNALVLETEEISGSTEVSTAYGGGVVLNRETCRVRGQIKPSFDSDIRFEVWLPEAATWNSRYQGIGGGGNAGNVSLSSMRNALDGGYAVSGQDNGHIGRSDESSHAVGHPEKVIDFGWRSLHEVAVASKAIIAAYYGRSPGLSLFNVCSTGGRQGLALAQRFPDDYDGISAGAPANYWPELSAVHAEFGRFLVENPEAWVSTEKMTMVQEAVHEACGAIDGIIDDPAACTFDMSTLACTGEARDDCLTEGEIAGIEKRFADLVDDDGTLIYPGFSHGLESNVGPNWMGLNPEDPFYSSHTWRYPDRFFADYVHAREDWSVREFDWKTDLKAAQNGVIGISVAAEDPDLSAAAAGLAPMQSAAPSDCLHPSAMPSMMSWKPWYGGSRRAMRLNRSLRRGMETAVPWSPGARGARTPKSPSGMGKATARRLKAIAAPTAQLSHSDTEVWRRIPWEADVIAGPF